MTIYFISGLGADRRAFEKIRLPEGYTPHFIDWKPVKGTESLEEYAEMMAKDIEAEQPFILAGLSFGGIVAAEIAKFRKPEKLIMISTVASGSELPLLYRLAGKLRLERIMPHRYLSLTLPFLYWFFGPLSREAKVLITSFLKQTDEVFLKWALGRISRWKHQGPDSECIRIHGKLDKVFPSRLTRRQYVIAQAGHLCVHTHAGEVNEILMKELA